MIKKIQLREQWKDIDHLATASNIMKYEFACCWDRVYKKVSMAIKPKPLKHGEVKWLMRDGKVIS